MLVDWFTVGAQAANFLILAWLLKRFLYRPILNAIDERERRIANELADAKAIKTLAEQEKAEFEQKNEQLAQQRAAMLVKAESEVMAERTKMLNQARSDADDFRSRWQASIQRELQQMETQVGRRTREEVLSISRKVLADLADANLEQQIVTVFLARLDELDSGTKQLLEREPGATSAQVRSAFDLSPDQQANIRDRIKASLHTVSDVEFESTSDLIGGIELTLGGRRIAWSMEEYLVSFADLMSGPDGLQKSKPSAQPTIDGLDPPLGDE